MERDVPRSEFNALREDFRHFAYGNGDGTGGADGRLRLVEGWVKAHSREHEDSTEREERKHRELRTFVGDLGKMALKAIGATILAGALAHWGFDVHW